MNKRDIELLISARETTGRTFKTVVSNIESLNQKIDEQVAAAQRGEGSLADLKRSQDALAQAGRDLSGLQGQIDAYARLEAQQEKNTAASVKAGAEYDAMKAKLAGLETVTAAQERELAKLEKKNTTASAALTKTTADLTLQAEALQRAGVETTQLDAVQAQIVNTARQAGSGFVQLGAALDGYSDNLNRARTSEQALAAQTAFDSKIAKARELGDASRFVQLYADAAQTATVADNQLAALDGFRLIGQQAVEASQDMSRFVQTGQTMAVTSQQVAAGLRSILDPGNEALRTLDGVEAAIQQASAAAEAEKGSVASYSNALNELSSASAALVQQGGLVDAFKQQEQATDGARAKFAQAQAEVTRLGAAMLAADAPVEELARDLRAAENALTETGRALGVEETKLGQLSRSLKQAGIDTNNLTAAQGRLEAAANQTAAATVKANQTLGRGGEKPTGLFGLNPYEIQNLGYQINDIFVGLASGQKPLTILTQQGLQITQLFPGMISGLVKFAARWFPLIAVVTTVIGVFGHYIQQANQLKEINNALASNPLGANYDAAKLSEISNGLQLLGVSAEEAKDTLLAFVDEGLDPSRLDNYAAAAKNLADRLGIDLAEATSLLTDIQNGGIESVLDLTEKTGDLTVAEIEHATALFDAGKAAEARQYILDLVAEKNAQIAKATESQWTPAVKNLKIAFNNFLGFLADLFEPFARKVQQRINEFVLGLTYVASLLAGNGFDKAMSDAKAVFDRQQALSKAPASASARGASRQDIRDIRYKQSLDKEYTVAKDLTREERRRRAEVDARRKAQAAGVSPAVEELAVSKALLKVDQDITKEKKKGRSRKDTAASKRANAIESSSDSLISQLRQLDSATGRGKSATLEERLSVVDNKYEKIYDTLAKLNSLGFKGTVDGKTLAQITAETEQAKARLKVEESIKYYEDQISLLQTQRKDEIETIVDAQERGAKSVAEAYEAAEGVNSRISPQIKAAALEALNMARTLAGANPSPEMVSMIARLERLVAGEGVTNIVNKVGLDALSGQEAKLNNLLREREDLVQSINTLNELGIYTDAEARQKTAEAYNMQAGAISPVLEQLRQTVELLHQQKDALTGLPLLSDAAYAAWLAKIEAVNAGLVHTDQRLKTVQQAGEQAIANGITDAFNTAGEAIWGLISGTQSFGEAAGNIFKAALGIVAQFTKAVADAIIQMIALEAAKSVIKSLGGLSFLGFHSGGVVGGGMGSSQMTRSGIGGSWFGAPKFHNGGGMGLRPDEYKAVLKKNEEVLTEDDPRHIRNLGRGGSGGSGQSSAPQLKQVLVLQPEDIAGAMQTRPGQQSVLTTIRANAPAVKQALGIK